MPGSALGSSTTKPSRHQPDEPFKASHFEGPSGFRAFAAGGAIGGIGGSAASKSTTPDLRSQPKPRAASDREVIGIRRESSHLCNAKTMIVFQPSCSI
jgi:hypothetical protein